MGGRFENLLSFLKIAAPSLPPPPPLHPEQVISDQPPIVSFYSDTAERNEKFVDTSEVRTLTLVGKLVNSILILGKLPLNFLVNY